MLRAARIAGSGERRGEERAETREAAVLEGRRLFRFALAVTQLTRGLGSQPPLSRLVSPSPPYQIPALPATKKKRSEHSFPTISPDHLSFFPGGSSLGLFQLSLVPKPTPREEYSTNRPSFSSHSSLSSSFHSCRFLVSLFQEQKSQRAISHFLPRRTRLRTSNLLAQHRFISHLQIGTTLPRSPSNARRKPGQRASISRGGNRPHTSNQPPLLSIYSKASLLEAHLRCSNCCFFFFLRIALRVYGVGPAVCLIIRPAFLGEPAPSPSQAFRSDLPFIEHACVCV